MRCQPVRLSSETSTGRSSVTMVHRISRSTSWYADQSVTRANNLSPGYFGELGSRWLRDCPGRLANDLDEAYNHKDAHLVAIKDRSIATHRVGDRFFGRFAHVP